MSMLKSAVRGLLAASLIFPLVALADSRTAAAPAAKPADDTVHRADAPRTRDEVSAEVERAMRDGNWRCLTNNRGWCDRPMRAGPYVHAGNRAAEGSNRAPRQRPSLQ